MINLIIGHDHRVQSKFSSLNQKPSSRLFPSPNSFVSFFEQFQKSIVNQILEASLGIIPIHEN